ncbi:MAG TPA: hypothetical protein VFI15_01340, partial [Candidatus Limnocylindrales bacterium]|nr:hypothetical protein [Candidatus Limnocylindrales bacterium]
FGFHGTPIRLVFRERSAAVREPRRPVKARNRRRPAGAAPSGARPAAKPGAVPKPGAAPKPGAVPKAGGGAKPAPSGRRPTQKRTGR